MDVSARLKFLREQKGYSVNKLANLSGVSQSYLRDVERGDKNPTVLFLSEICDVLDISLKDFFDVEQTDGIFNDPLMQQVYKLSAKQRETLAAFLQTNRA